MKSFDLNLIPQMIEEGTITSKGAVNLICCFISRNYPVFGLLKYDEDVREDVVVKFMERGERFLRTYNPQQGSFFCYLHNHITSIINSLNKSMYRRSITDRINFEECIITTEEKMLKYQKLDYHLLEQKKVPYAPSKVPADELCKTLRSIADGSSDKKLLVLALKSSFYITDDQVEKVCQYYKIKPSFFYQIIQLCKDSVLKKKKHREELQERRNFAYYHHKRYRKMIDGLSDDTINADHKRMKFQSLENKHRKNWKRLNSSFEKGIMQLRPTNKTIADMLGICERQVTYCINSIREEADQNERKKIVKL